MKPLRCAVIGVGYLGKFHAQKYARIPGCELVAVVDSRLEVAEAVAQPLGCRAVTDCRELLGQVEAVSIVVPTQGHHAVCMDFLNAGVHVLVEKPMTTTLEQALSTACLTYCHKYDDPSLLLTNHPRCYSALVRKPAD
jgi:predicted dehydrogenase